jgi:hypothetical protein
MLAGCGPGKVGQQLGDYRSQLEAQAGREETTRTILEQERDEQNAAENIANRAQTPPASDQQSQVAASDQTADDQAQAQAQANDTAVRAAAASQADSGDQH